MRPLLAAAAVLCAVTAAEAQTIYPIDRAEILMGAHFDFKSSSRNWLPPTRAKSQ